jgi:rubredoxin
MVTQTLGGRRQAGAVPVDQLTKMGDFAMQIAQIVRCPNCGGMAQRHSSNSNSPASVKSPEDRITKTECPVCDYLMATRNGNPVEAYAPGLSALAIARKFNDLR